uniref:Uncharacterized protein n=1 Tax=Anguilla anguilla TaxID=7936 RepID=A0A0E9TGA3_ANGAN
MYYVISLFPINRCQPAADGLSHLSQVLLQVSSY